ncbi:nucleotidyltransferase family protein [Rhizobium leguminosarum]|uniref:Nucleotidyltransferase family protein n=1 Tax=Rhizobium leguminosarum TaxID=384 RepID=A0AAJ1A440_RHILE|nr:nucleotidyltransferase family protein [Rhizobium leguminosarum]MBY5532772.1 nucleotidyltransferase family protein [Rhizobium leguminosarum]MBY5599405.1 nucleotidyltransferase family protein [Rhizobium leguminosarum]MBY5614983.1 nucleotidyltransferase family protein [Rhizobium leguminosarum]MBY5626984.1 nucleotidyltransferase family protein [Rhizobium leguminosarum]MBY5733951.1 nucleotidyltransferase family protein [Rhizobium leguminosarum]
MTIRQAMVLAAGLGTRMRPITDTIPKPLVKIDGKPMIDYALDCLVAAGIKRAVVNVHHHADQMLEHLGNYHGLDIVISDERDALMNSGGGLAKGLRLLSRDNIFVMNADLFWIGEQQGRPTNLERLAGFFDAERMDMALLCVGIEHTTGHNGKNDFSLAADGQLTRYRDDPSNPVVYAGAIAMNPSLFDDAPKDAFNLNIYFDKAIARGRLFGIVLEGHWLTVGTPDAIGEAEETIRRLRTFA